MISRAVRTLKSTEAVDALLSALFASTMGQQLREVLAEEQLSDVLIARLRNALRIRNFLAHDYFRERAEQFLSFRSRNEMLAELEEFRAELEATDNELEPITRSILVAKGISEEMLLAEFERFRAEHGDGDLRVIDRPSGRP